MRAQIRKLENGIHITWPEAYIPSQVYRKIRHYTHGGDYRKLEGKSLAKFHQLVRALNSKYEANVSVDSAISIRNIVMKEKIIRAYGRMNRNIGKISMDFTSTSILELSAEYDFPPLNLLRGILLFRGYSPTDIYEVFTGRKSPTTILRDRNLEQYKLAVKNDAESSFNQSEIAKIAADNERAIVSWFNSIGISMKNQEDLVAEQQREYGRAVATPDILFLEPVYVNDVRVHWLDFKDYVGTEIPFIFNSNVDQASRYVEKWGPGVMCYRGGVVDNVVIPGTMCLSGEFLGIDFK